LAADPGAPLGEKGLSDDDKSFAARRADLKTRIDAIDAILPANAEGRRNFFASVYDQADGDPSAIPWADLKPKDRLVDWLSTHPGSGKTAIDVACGLGDNAIALAQAGYATTAFDLSETAVDWARRRFGDCDVDFRVGDLLALPARWMGAFDLAHEAYTIQSVPPNLQPQISAAVAGLVAKGGRLLVYTRIRPDGAAVSGPPWPITHLQAEVFSELGLQIEKDAQFDLVRPDRVIPHRFTVWHR
jgi:SAM-dependent methyltransferase